MNFLCTIRGHRTSKVHPNYRRMVVTFFCDRCWKRETQTILEHERGIEYPLPEGWHWR
jgi:hypothetical protein